jgi:long-chain acyl-CoA synthetase
MSDTSITNNAQADQDSSSADAQQLAHPWLRHYERGVPQTLDIPDRPLTWLLDNAVQRFPNQTALIYYGTHITYARLSNLANRFAIGLQRLGVQKGDRVAIALPNIPQFPIAFFGALRAGATVVPTNPLYTEREMQHQLEDSGAKVIVMLDMYYPTVQNVCARTALEHIIITSPADYLPPLLRLLYPLKQRRDKTASAGPSRQDFAQDDTLRLMREMLAPHTRGGIELFNLPVPMSGEDLAVLQYTGGTTGLSKGAMLTHRNLLANAMQTRAWVPRLVDGTTATLCVTPFFHAYGLTVGMNFSIRGAATMILLPRFNAKDVLHLIHRYQPTSFPGIPTMYIALLREAQMHPEYLRSVTSCISGAMALPAQVQQEFETITRGSLVEGYGLSEASPVTHCNPLTEECRNGSIGLPLPGVDAAIFNPETGEQLPAGEVGELMVKGPNVMRGYWNQTEETTSTFYEDWLHTGDIARMDEEGFFTIVERAKDLIVASGFNVYPREVEEVLYHHPATLEVAVTGVTDSYRGETVAAFVVLKPEFEASEQMRQDLLKHCRQDLSAYKVPKILEFRESLPKSLVGKILRRVIREEFQKTRATQIAADGHKTI